MICSVIGTPISERIKVSSSSSQSTGFPEKRSNKSLKNPKAIDRCATCSLRGLKSPFSAQSGAERPIEIKFHPIQHSIDEFPRFFGAKFLCDINRLVDCHHRRYILGKKHFINRDPKDVA